MKRGSHPVIFLFTPAGAWWIMSGHAAPAVRCIVAHAVIKNKKKHMAAVPLRVHVSDTYRGSATEWFLPIRGNVWCLREYASIIPFFACPKKGIPRKNTLQLDPDDVGTQTCRPFDPPESAALGCAAMGP